MIDETQRLALLELRRLDWAPTQEDVWSPLDIHIDALNGEAGAALLRAYGEASTSTGRSPLGLILEGQHGAGKTHLLRWAREQVQRGGGYFFLLGISDGRAFWPNVVQTLLRGLRRSGSYRHTQLEVLLDRLCERAAVGRKLRDQIRGRQQLTTEALDAFVTALRRADPGLGRECRHTVRALVLLAATDDAIQDLGEAFLTSIPDEDPGDHARWSLPSRAKTAQEIAEEISRLLASTGASMLAVDQIDTVIAQARTSAVHHGQPEAMPTESVAVAEDLGRGLMQLREALRRTVTVVACLPTSWQLISNHTVDSVRDRFRRETRLSRLPSPDVGAELVAARFGPLFEAVGFVAPYPTWPVLPSAFSAAPDYTPRSLLERVDEHLRVCLTTDHVEPLRELDQPPASPAEDGPTAPSQDVESVQRRFVVLRESIGVDRAMDPVSEDVEMPRLLGAGLRAWTIEQGDRNGRYKVVLGEDGNPSMHAWLRESLDESTEDEAHWSFRALSHTHHRAVQARIERLRLLVGLDPAVDKRRAVLLRNTRWPTGPVTKRLLQEFEDAGGLITRVSTEDLRTFAALAALLDENATALGDWLRLHRPAGSTTLFRTVFGTPSGSADPQPHGPAGPDGPTGGPRLPEPVPADPGERGQPGRTSPGDVDAVRRSPTAGGEGLLLGTAVETGAAVRVPMESLRKHTAIFAGSGSGKTVLIRRLIEECALQGVSTIVLDPNNDLARLGDPWPEAPPSWQPGDAERAAAYLEGTDVVVWTPRREAGRPLSLQPLPDFAAVLDEPDELALALDTAVAGLAPRARMGGKTAKMDRGRAVLREALAYFAHSGGMGLRDFVALLAELPDNATTLTRAGELAHDMAETLKAAMILDPLFGGAGVPLDPGILLTPSTGKRARISVISLVGLPSNEQRQGFVNQLQMALFAWIKQHPAGDRPLGGLFVMDEAQTLAPSGSLTACTESTLALASQARKYGLGLIFATQAPKGIHNRIVGNAATQFFGFLNSPIQIAAAKEVAQAKASAVLDISRLTAGQFYAVGEGLGFQKLATPMCLSHHPTSALTVEEVLVRARS
ncbi:helicase HerA domain-containing protein [Micromonospora sp. NPDC049102]|uniref:helicase HerA domain-containing protein n=1 Tax=Micromonospora sp. NPDC049102 TaxID=3364265 RepID=UPI0037110CA7